MIDWDGVLLGPVEGVFGQPAVYQTADGRSFPLNGVFDEAFTDVDVVNGEQVTTTKPCYGFRVASLPVPPRQKDKLFIPSAPGAPLVDTTYVIKKAPQIDGHGWCLLKLNVAS
ncbi:hypothetical protein AB3X91_11765 [Paraburkholderia sp. BR14263]|uniref:head-tail joining protein n=1 Tax=unclassified Paraburkholderia TaxID=2615204 RepID=UPI0034CE515B